MTNEPIAIIGMGCRYPQATGLEALWRLLLEGRDGIAPYDEIRFRELDAAYAQTAVGRSVLATHWGGFLPGVDRFDASFFGISPREAAFIDPQQRLLLEVSWNALEDAGQLRANYQGSRTGVFTGLWTTDYENHIFRNSEQPEFYLLTGGGRSTACGRISFTFGFEGPSISVDTACSSSMVAIHLACQSLRQRECDMALAGGVNIILSTDFTLLFTNAGMLSPDGRCKFGDERANGFVRSEGAGMVVLKRLSDAVAAGDGIYAVIRGSAVNNDGKSSGLLVTPSRDGQKKMLLEAWHQAGIAGSDLSYIEAHGTGTQVGDPIEIGAISDALRATGANKTVPIGSMKSNIGHTESAAGVGGVIKTALVLHRGMIPASLQHQTPNPAIDWEYSPVEVARETRPLPASTDGAPRVAGASSFGLTGTNAHMVLAEYQVPLPIAAQIHRADSIQPDYLLPITAYTSESLIQNAKSWLDFLQKESDPSRLVEICFLAGARRTHLPYRYVALGQNARQLCDQLEALIAGEPSASPETGIIRTTPVRAVFVCPGQGSQWDGMARELFRGSPAFRDSFKQCDRAIQVENGWSLIQRLEGPDAASFLTDIDFVQPALFAMSVALAAVWQDAGVQPQAVVGHSMGEVAAAHLAGILSLEDAAAVICRRSRLMRTLSGSGVMASIELPAAEVERWIAPLAGKVSIAAENSPGTTVVAGETEAVDQLLEWLELKEVFCRRVKVDVASHSALVDAILPALADQLASLRPQQGEIPFFSTVRGAITRGDALDSAYWVSNLRQPVRLTTATAELVRSGFNCFVELSPHPILVSALEDTLRTIDADRPGSFQSPDSAVVLPSLSRGNPAWPALLRSLGRLWVLGGQLDWAALLGRLAGPIDHRVQLPEYVFERERFWPEEDSATVGGIPKSSPSRLSPLLLSRTDPANDPGVTIFAINADLASLPYLKDHRVGGSIVFPASAHLEAVLEAATVLAPEKHAVLEEIDFLQALYLSETEAQQLQLVFRRVIGKPGQFAFSLMGSQGPGEDGWTEHSRGVLCLEDGKNPGTVVSSTIENATSLSGGVEVRHGTAEEHYGQANRSGLQYGPAFQLVESFVIEHPRATTLLRATDGLFQPGYRIHPAILDNCFQAMLHLRPQGASMSSDDVYLPVHIRRLEVNCIPADLPLGEVSQLVTEAVFLSADTKAATLDMKLTLKTLAGQVLAVLDAMTVQRIKSREGDSKLENLFVMGWKELRSLPAPALSASAGKHWLIFADGSAGESASENSLAEALARRHAELAGRCTLVWLAPDFRPLGPGERRLDLIGADEYELPIGDTQALDRLLGLVAAEAGRISDIFNLWTFSSLDAGRNPLESLMAAQPVGTHFIPTLVQAVTRAGWTNPPRFWLFTQGTQNLPGFAPSSHLAGATVWGMGRTLTREHPELAPVLIDLSPKPRHAVPDLNEVDAIVRLAVDEHGQQANAATWENQVALRGKAGFAGRVSPCYLPTSTSVPRPVREGESWRIETETPGVMSQLQLRVVPSQAPAPGEVRIQVAAAGLNFIDVTKALGIYPGLDPLEPVQMGGECSGRIVAVGFGIEHLQIGQEVVALTPSPTRVGMLASHVNVPAALVLPRPADLSLAEAAALPIAYLTAHYALNELARLRAGEWVLIHAGAGGVGLAAARIALAKGARVIATASSPEKHTFLHGWGVKQVLSSRSLDFAEGVLALTEGRGVDVILNSLSGDFIVKSLEVLAPYGRFIELGKRDIYEDRRVGLKAFRHNIAYFAVDLAALIEEKPEYAADMFREVIRAVEERKWAALPVRSFVASQPAEAFQFMAQGRHIGKLALDFAGLRDLQVLPAKESKEKTLFERSATYLLTGGLGGVGLAVAEWMAVQGAGNLVLVSRRQPGPAEEEMLHRVRAQGALVEYRRTDLLDLAAVERLVGEIRTTMPPLRGVFHAAAVIDDALVDTMSPQRFDAVFAPKIRGTWNLHQATLDVPLDYFVMFSSFASVFPQPGHGSYAAANSFMDAFAGYRRSLGLAACSVNWAGWLGLGLARETGTSRTIEAYEAEGFGSFQREEALNLLGNVLRANPVQVLAVSIHPEKLIAVHEEVPPLFREVAGQPPAAADPAAKVVNHPLLEEIQLQSSYPEKLGKLESILRMEVSRVLRLSPDRIASNQVFGQMGIDSLMALEFIRRVNRALGLALPATAVFNYPTIAALAVQIAKRLGLEADATSESVSLSSSQGLMAQEKVSHGKNVQTAFEDISEEDALRALMEPFTQSGEGVGGD